MCCGMLQNERDKRNCQEDVEDGDARDCMRASERFCASTMPNEACMSLATCCAMLQDDDDKEDCEEVVEDDEARDCMRANQRFCTM